MNRFFAIFCAAAVTLTTYIEAPAADASRPNVVLIISDDQAWTDFGFMSHPVIQTPHIDQLASEGLVYTRGYVPTSLCRASLASIITGRYPHEHGLTSNDPPQGADRRRMHRHMSGAETLPRVLARRGYLSFQSGKWWEGHFSLGGFTHGMTHGDPSLGGRHGDEGLRIGREGLDELFEFIHDCGDQPFFVWYAPFLPHTPHNPPQRLLDRYTAPDLPPKLASYYAMCEWFDETCGALIEYLDDHDLSSNTLVAFVVDNGWIQQTGPGRTTRGWFAPKSKLSPYDGGVRSPIILRMPGRIAPRRDDERLVSSIDLVPTILAACDAELPADLPGVDLLASPKESSANRTALFGELFTHDAVDIDNPAANLTHRWCVEGWWKLIEPAAPAEPAELYDLKSDPHENVNVAAHHPDIVARLKERLDRWWTVP